MRLISTEAVSKYHPDKYADQISDAIVTECLRQDKNSHCGIETLVKDNTVVIAGELTTNAKLDIDDIVHRVARKLKYPVTDIIYLVSEQSKQINDAVTKEDAIGAGDQGIMFGYATNETESRLPAPFELANKIIAKIENDVENNPYTVLKGDAKTQVTADFDTSEIYSVTVSVCHKEGVKPQELNKYVSYLLSELVDENILKVNPAGSWTDGGPKADCGLTGRKIVCDQYGGFCPVGGGALSGKDFSKVDRTATYMARQIATDIVDKFDVPCCMVQLGFVIGEEKPVSVTVVTGTDEDYADYVRENYDLSVKGMINFLHLNELDLEKVSEGCHFFDKKTCGARKFIKEKDEND